MWDLSQNDGPTPNVLMYIIIYSTVYKKKCICIHIGSARCYSVQGQVYHFINELLPANNYPLYLQLYFYVSEHEIDNQLRMSDKLSLSVIQKLIAIEKVNLYSNFF